MQTEHAHASSGLFVVVVDDRQHRDLLRKCNSNSCKFCVRNKSVFEFECRIRAFFQKKLSFDLLSRFLKAL